MAEARKSFFNLPLFQPKIYSSNDINGVSFSPIELFKHRFRHLNIGQKIGLGYAVSLSVAIAGAIAGIVIGNVHYQQARDWQEDVDEEFRLAWSLQSNLSNVLLHEREIAVLLDQFEQQQITVDEFNADFKEEYIELLNYAEATEQSWRDLKASYDKEHSVEETFEEVESYQAIVQQYDGLSHQYTTEVKRSLTEILSAMSADQASSSLLYEFKESTLPPEFHEFVESVATLFNNVLADDAEAEIALERAEELRTQIIVISLLLSAVIAAVLSFLVSWAISSPIQSTTQLARQVTQERNFDLHLPVTTTDEIGVLTMALNNLIYETKQLLTEQKAAEARLIQTEKMSSLGQLVAGVAHEINNPANFIHGNLTYAQQYATDLLELINLYQREYPEPSQRIQAQINAIDLDFLESDLIKMLESMRSGSNRIREIVKSLRTFSRMDEAEIKPVDIHDGIDSTLMILHHRIKEKYNRPAIAVTKSYGCLPLIECYASALNQVFMNLLSNAIDALDELFVPASSNPQTRLAVQPTAHLPTIHIRTTLIPGNRVAIHITDNGGGISSVARERLFDPFYTTKPVGKGTGLGLSISHQIVVERHHGELKCYSNPGNGTEFVVEIPIQQTHRS